MEKYIKYKALDFSEDPAFIQWVQGGFQDQDAIWNQVKNHSASLQEEIEEAIKIVQVFTLKADSPADKIKEEALFDRIEKTIATNAKIGDVDIQQKPGIVRFLVPLAAAAAIAVLVLIFLPRQDSSIYTTTATQSKVEHALPDESIVIMDAHASISYEKSSDFLKTRRVKLEGQAFFKVQKGEEFIVETKYGTVEVLGTTFNVNTEGGLFVHCVTGTVKVSNGRNSVINTRGEMSYLNDGKVVEQPSKKDKLEWYTATYEFKAKPLSTVLQEIEKEYQIEIQSSEEINRMVYTGFFESSDLEQAIKAVTWPLGLTYELRNEEVIIKK